MREREFFFNIKEHNGNKLYKKLLIPKFNVIICQYNILLSDFKHLAKIFWKVIIIDEGQRIKNNESKTFHMAAGLQTEYRILLSGTPL